MYVLENLVTELNLDKNSVLLENNTKLYLNKKSYSLMTEVAYSDWVLMSSL